MKKYIAGGEGSNKGKFGYRQGQKKDYVKTQGEDSHQPANERRLRKTSTLLTP